MPMLFDYECESCGEVKEYLVRNSETKPEKCSNCDADSDKLKRKVCYNAGGFYGLPMSSMYGRTDKFK